MKIYFVFILILIILMSGCVSQEKSFDNESGYENNNITGVVNNDGNSFEENNGDSNNEKIEKTNCPPIFTNEFTDFSKINAFGSIGSITGASRGRSYIEIKEGENVPVYAPVDATLISVIYAYRGPEADHGEYGFLFDAGCGVSFLLDHLDSVSEELKEYAPEEPSRSTATSDRISVPIKGGTLLGYTDGTPGARTFDFLVLDEENENFYINPQRWEWEQSLYSVCPYDFYEDDLKEKYYQKIGIVNAGELVKADDCGHISYDVENTISGGWFRDDDSTDLNGEYALIGERVGFVDVVVKTEREGVLLRITDYEPGRLPVDVGIGESVCYEGFSDDWVYLHLVDGNTIEISSGNGECPESLPEDGWTRYYR